MGKFWHGLLHVLSIGGQPAVAIVSLFDPPVGALMNMGLNLIVKAEANQGSGTGASKMRDVTTTIAAFSPMLISTFESMTGKKLGNEDLFAQGTNKIMDGLVDVLNAFGGLGSKNAVAPPIATPAA